MRNLTYQFTTLTNDDDGICQSQAVAGAASMTLNGALVVAGVATWPDAQLVTVTSAGNDTGITFTFTGPGPDGTTISQVVTGANGGAASSTFFFKGLTSVVTSGAVATTAKVGVLNTGGAVSKSLRVNGQQMDFKADIRVLLPSGTLTYTAQYTMDQPEDTYAVSYSTSADWQSVDGLTALAASGVSNVFYKTNAIRLKIVTYTSGAPKITVSQSY